MEYNFHLVKFIVRLFTYLKIDVFTCHKLFNGPVTTKGKIEKSRSIYIEKVTRI